MTDFKVKYNKPEEKSVEEKAISAVINFLKRHKGWTALGCLGIFVALYYTVGFVIGLFVFLLLALFVIFGKHIYDLIEWVREAKGEKQHKRIIILFITAVGLLGIYSLIKWLILPTGFGQAISSFIWRSF